MKKKYKIVRFYARAYCQEFSSQLEAERAITAHATRPGSAMCYTELWEMKNDEDGEMLAVYDYGSIPPERLVKE